MPETLQPYGVRVPALDEASVEGLPGQLKQMIRDLEKGLVGVASNEADRNNRFGEVPAGCLVLSWQQKTLWLKTSSTNSAAWATLFSDTGVQTSGINPRTGWALEDGTGWQIVNGQVTVDLFLRRTGTAIVNTSTPYLTNQVVADLASAEAMPRQDKVTQWAGASHGAMALWKAGAFVLLTMGGESQIATDEIVQANWSYAAKAV